MVSLGLVYAAIGIAIAASLGAIGSSIGMSLAGQAASGVLSEKPSLYGRVLVIQAIPGTQSIYGFLVAVLLMTQVGFIGGSGLADYTNAEGLLVLAAALPVALVGLVSGIYQGKAAASAIVMAGKDEALATRGMILAAMVETAMLLALLISVLMFLQLP